MNNEKNQYENIWRHPEWEIFVKLTARTEPNVRIIAMHGLLKDVGRNISENIQLELWAYGELES